MALSRTAAFYRSHPQSRKRHVEYQAEFNKKPSQVKKRVELNKYNRKHKSRKGDGMDASHLGNRIIGFSSASRNRGDRNNSAGDRRARGKKR
jgi:hypothetical protein